MNKIVIIICLLCTLCTVSVKAQNTLAKLEYEEAEQCYLKGDYANAVTKLQVLEDKGFKNPKVLHLRIMARSCFVLGISRIDYILSGFLMLEKLNSECDFYLNNYDIEGLEDKYKEVFTIKKELAKFPQTQAAWDARVAEIKSAEKSKKNKIIQEFLNSFVLVEKGSFYKNAKSHGLVYRKNGYKDTTNYRPVKTTVANSFYISKGVITNELYWALYQTPVFSYVTVSPEYRNKGDNDPMFGHPVLGTLTKNMEPAYPGDLNVSYPKMKAFIEKINAVTGKSFRLPSDDEWEYAMRGGQKQRLVETKYVIGGNKRKGFKYRYVYTYKDRVQFAEPNELGMVFYKLSSPGDKGVSQSEMTADKVYKGCPPSSQSIVGRGMAHGRTYLIEELWRYTPKEGGYNPEKDSKEFRLVMDIDKGSMLGNHSETESIPDSDGYIHTKTGLKYRVTKKVNFGDNVKENSTYAIHYTCKLSDGKVIDDSYKGEPPLFTITKGSLIPGFYEGVKLLKPGEKGTFVIPPDLAYGTKGNGIIPPDETLVFEIEVLSLVK
ncbi:FKBP-type peptidyl-prolyl cis-trans isomerase [Flavobacterium beibuense]|uniref:FKBP-type peptidyl-prolyl cis-trans isomerase n=1 Tax=Flavobacterium beibuense TaxID=657326 RepID=UPI003A90ED1E